MSNYQKIGLKKVLTDASFYDMLSISHFSHKTSKYIYKTIVNYYSKFYKVPTIDILKGAITNSLPEDKANMYIAYLDSIYKLDVEDIEQQEILDGLEGDLLTRTIDNNIEALTDAAYNKNIDKIREVMFDINNSLIVESKHPKDIRYANYDKTNIKYVESWVGTMRLNGVNLSGLTIVGAKSGGGKSVFTLQQALYSYKQGLNVVLMSLELPENEILARLYANETGTPYGEALASPKDINAWKDKFFSRPNSFKIMNSPIDSEELFKIIDAEAKAGADVLIIDYLQLVESTNYGDEWKHLARLARKLHLKSMETQTVIITPVQIDVRDVEVEAARIEVKVRGSRELENSASLFLCLYASPDEASEDVTRLFTIKARNGITKTYMLENMLECMRFNDTGLCL